MFTFDIKYQEYLKKQPQLVIRRSAIRLVSPAVIPELFGGGLDQRNERT